MGTDSSKDELSDVRVGASSDGRKPYRRPRLVAYGDFRRLTAGDMSTDMADTGGQGPKSKLGGGA